MGTLWVCVDDQECRELKEMRVYATGVKDSLF
jgi:hypothetical protein